VVTGPAASGKTTQAALLAQRYGVPRVTLDALLAEAASLPRTCQVRCALVPWCRSRRGVVGSAMKVTHWSNHIPRHRRVQEGNGLCFEGFGLCAASPARPPGDAAGPAPEAAPAPPCTARTCCGST